jgi:hypothetical protein
MAQDGRFCDQTLRELFADQPFLKPVARIE